jgi:hypothetical protein
MLDQVKLQALTTALTDMVGRIVAGSGLSEQEVIDIIFTQTADDTTASVGSSTTKITTVRGAFLAAKAAIADELTGAPVGLTTLLDIANEIVVNRGNISDLEGLVAGLSAAFNYVGTLSGGVDSGSAFDLDSLAIGSKDAGDYYKVTTGGFFTQTATNGGNPFELVAGTGVVWNTSGGVDFFDNRTSEVFGTTDEVVVTGSVDTGFTVALATAVKDRLTTLETALTQLNNFGVLTPVSYPTLIADVTLTTINALTVGTYNFVGTATQLGIDSAVVAGATPVVGQAKVVDVGSGNKQVHLQVVVEGIALSKTIKGDVADSTTPTNASVIGWVNDQATIEEVVDTLIAAFDAAAV